MLFKRSIVSWTRRHWLNLFKLAVFLSTLCFAYWSIYWEIIYWKKSLDQAFFASSGNWILMFGCFYLLLAIFFFERRKKKTGHDRGNLWLLPVPELEKAQRINPEYCHKQALPPAEGPILLVAESDTFKPPQPTTRIPLFGSHQESSASRKGKRRFHIRFLRQTKRFFSGFLLILYILLSIVSLSGGSPMFVLFLGTAFIVFDYLWKTRRTAKI